MGKRTGRRRGAPDGNANRLVHGRYAQEAVARQRIARARRHEAQLLLAWTDVVARIQAMKHAGVPVPPELTVGGGGTPSET